ncbi:MAG TPA: exodeoxyribonuclease VII large subunit [Bacteroidota bacterium]|jgi:exodeoxyribonuclease VII large subunit|nr:exodeoxyribonuclease VII large subunit [Bacteroidota bacterium]
MSSNGQIISVSELTRRIKSVLEVDFSNVTVQGEISNCKLHSSGHVYFTLKDEGSEVKAVMWRSRAAGLFFTPQDGMKIIAKGKITVYEVRGVYQIDVAQLQPLGVGELQLAFERLKQRLAGEGLFASEHKKPLPKFPRRIGIITSPTGAALRDMMNIINRRFPAVEIILCAVNVQGEGAAEEIAGAIADMNEHNGVDVIIVGRGGGSLEDLWAFNEEVVARAIYRSKLPIISAVGHEIDFTIADFVADLRAPTPSAAAELVVCNFVEILENLRNFHYTVEQIISDSIAAQREKIRSMIASYSFNRPHDMLRQYSQKLDEHQRLLSSSVRQRISMLNQQSTSFRQRLESLNPAIVLERGYAMVFKGEDVVSEAGELRAKDRVLLKFRDGELPAAIED